MDTVSDDRNKLIRDGGYLGRWRGTSPALMMARMNGGGLVINPCSNPVPQVSQLMVRVLVFFGIPARSVAADPSTARADDGTAEVGLS